ncbi:MAG: hypothetical protein J1E40_08375 [Oscillospiraceae bacterium]|nr:hypothetical protein [Oscillospiraceae bacterium]
MITSMSQSELYKTLLGHYRPQYEVVNGRMVEKAVDKTTAGSYGKNADVQDVNLKDMQVYADISQIPKRDRFELSEGTGYTTGSIMEDKDLFAPYECTEAIDFNCTDIRAGIESGYVNGVVDKKRIAEYYGNMAKRLDEAYEEGKFTKEEYDELNEMINSQMEREISCAERRKAFLELGKKRYSLSPVAAKEVILREQSMTPEERFAERQQMISDYVEKYFKIDRTSLLELFNKIRYGK